MFVYRFMIQIAKNQCCPQFAFQVSYADKDPTLSDDKTYRSFLRTVPSEMDLNAAIVSFLQHHNWTKIFTLFQDASTEESKFAYVSVKYSVSMLARDTGVSP